MFRYRFLNRISKLHDLCVARNFAWPGIEIFRCDRIRPISLNFYHLSGDNDWFSARGAVLWGGPVLCFRRPVQRVMRCISAIGLVSYDAKEQAQECKHIRLRRVI